MLSRADLKQRAKDSMSSASLHPVLAGLVFLIISMGIMGISNFMIGIITAAADAGLVGSSNLGAAIVGAYALLLPLTLLPSIIVFALTSVMNVGFASYSLKTIRHMEAGLESFFQFFKFFFKVFGLFFMMQLFIFLWSLLFIIPGIVAAYRYRMAMYLFIDNPNKGILDCISESKYMMTGHKSELFVLDLSFILWSFLSVFTCGIASIYVFPYTQLTYAVYYDNLKYLCNPNNSPQQMNPMGPMGGPPPMNQFNQGNMDQQFYQN